ncbi:MAG: flagellar basal body P-ring formation chaperone FlgA [Desulfobacterales bacterium]|nr:flagellar basal body P-ring formation protein FlgA [Deltaproteobacteria bacterium]
MSNIKTNLSMLRCGGLMLMVMLASLFTLASGLWADPLTTIRISDRVEIDSAEILLGHMATIEGSDVRFNQRLKNIVIGKAPLPGGSHRFDLNDLQKRIKQHHIDLATVIIQAPPQIVVTRSHIEIKKHEIENIVSEFIVQQTPPDNTTMRIKEIRVPGNVILPKGRITYNVTAPRKQKLMGRCPITVDFSVNGSVHKKVWTTAMIEVLGSVVVTRKPLGRHKPITEDDIEMQTLDLSNLPANVLTDREAVIGKRTKRAVGAQTPLRADSIELPPLVKRGDLVVIIAESENLKITTLGQVKKKGRRGERIPVVNLDSKKVLQARVVDANTVKVDF